MIYVDRLIYINERACLEECEPTCQLLQVALLLSPLDDRLYDTNETYRTRIVDRLDGDNLT
jgi:hypothetical protein